MKKGVDLYIPSTPPTKPPTGSRRTLIPALALALLIVGWALVDFVFEEGSFAAIVSERVSAGEEAAGALLRFFGALVLALFVANGVGRRLHWVASGFVVLGLGHLTFGYVEPLIQGRPASLYEGLYESLLVDTVAGVLLAVGLVPKAPPAFSPRVFLVLAGLIVASIFGFEALEKSALAPPMASVDDLGTVVDLELSPLAWLTGWHWTLAGVPLVLALVTAVAAVHRGRQGDMRTWLVLAMVLYAGAQLHDYLAPTVYGSPFLTHADILSFAFAGLVAVGGILELRRVAAERAALLAVERENNQRLTELATMKADFTAMVVHELGGPLAAVRRLTEMLNTGEADPEVRAYALRAMEGEVDTLDTLVADVRASAAAERGDFKVRPRPVSLAGLLIDAEGFAYTLPGDHPVEIIPRPRLEDREEVMADPERIGQVLRNLLSNAAKYSPEGIPIELRVKGGHRRVRIEVADHGPGIHPDDARRIFEKFGRGRDRSGKKIAGVGLGLYLSRRIMQAHGGELTLDSVPGEGATFGFELDVVKREER